MEIITAKEAREIAENYVPYEIEPTVEYVMEKIKDYAGTGSKEINFNYNCVPCLYWDEMKTEKFESFMKKHGYSYEYIEEENWYCTSEEIKISW